MRLFCVHNLRKTCFVLFAFITCINAKAQLHADFTSNIQQGCSPIVVQFHNTSTGTATDWFWDLGNGATSTDKDSASAIYINPGTYTVKLFLKNASDQDSAIKVNYITVYENPIIALVAIP